MHAEEARELINRALRDIARVLHAGHHQYLPKADVRHLDQQFIACREMLAPYLK
jgi:hypothetical protein